MPSHLVLLTSLQVLLAVALGAPDTLELDPSYYRPFSLHEVDTVECYVPTDFKVLGLPGQNVRGSTLSGGPTSLQSGLLRSVASDSSLVLLAVALGITVGEFPITPADLELGRRFYSRDPLGLQR